MSNVNIKTDYGAVGDGQLQTLATTFNSGSPNLTVASISAVFSAADVGKKIAVQNWASSGSAVGALLCSISSVQAFSGGFQTIVLSTNAFLSASSVSNMIEWGTDDSGAFLAMNSSRAGQDVNLTIPAGRYCFAVSSINQVEIGDGLNSITANGSGAPTLTDLLGTGNAYSLRGGSPLGGGDQGIAPGSSNTSLIATVNAGSINLTLINSSEYVNWTANTWACMTGFDLQGFGNPPNLNWCEFVFITSISSANGTITIQNPLQNSYKQTWPAWVLGGPSALPCGGPAMLYQMNQKWNSSQTWSGVNFRATNTLFNCTMRSFSLNNSVCESQGPNCSVQNDFTLNNVTINQEWEADKLTNNCTITNSSFLDGVFFQSPSPYNTVMSNVSISRIFIGTPRNLTVTNCIIPSSIVLGAAFYGISDSVSITNSSFGGQAILGSKAEDDLTGAGAYQCSGGLITRISTAGTTVPPPWAVPGKAFQIGSRYYNENTWIVNDVWSDGFRIYIQTNQGGGFPPPVSPATTLFATTGIIRNFTFSGNSGSEDAVSWSNVINNRPLFSQWNYTYVGNIGTDSFIECYGQFVTMTITVGAGYSAGSFTFGAGPAVIFRPQYTQSNWLLSIDLTVPGTRTITPTGVTGGGGADANLAAPNGGSIWLVDTLQPKMTGAVGNGTVTLQITTNIGIAQPYAMPISTRIHG